MDQNLKEEQSEKDIGKMVQKEIVSWPDWLIFGIGTTAVAGFFLVLARFDPLFELFFGLNLLLWFLIYGFLAPGYGIERMIFGTSGYVGAGTGYILFSGLTGFLSLLIWFMVGAVIGNLKISYQMRFFLLVAVIIVAAGGSFRLIVN